MSRISQYLLNRTSDDFGIVRGSIRMAVLIAVIAVAAPAQTDATIRSDAYVSTEMKPGSFVLSASGVSAPIFVSSRDFSGVVRAAKDLAEDVERVTSAKPLLIKDSAFLSTEIVIVGTIGKNAWIDSLISRKKISVEGVAGKWETFLIQIIDKPFTGVEKALVIAGSDKRGTIFGVYSLSAHLGVSPWLLVGGCARRSPHRSLRSSGKALARRTCRKVPGHIHQ